MDRRADVWAFGVVLYELLTGKRMFEGETVSDILAAVLKVEPDLSGAPAKVRPLLERCLQKDPKKRLQAVGDWELVLEKEALIAPAPRSKLAWALGAGALALIAIAASWTAWRAMRPVDHPLIRLSVDLGPDAVEGTNSTAVISPDGTRLVYVARGADGK